MRKILSTVCSTIRYLMSKHKCLLKLWLWIKKFKTRLRSFLLKALLWLLKWKRPIVASLVALPTIFVVWYFDLLPATWSLVKELGLIGWAFYLVIEYLIGKRDPERQARFYAQAKQKLEDEAKRREARKQRILTVYKTYITSLGSTRHPLLEYVDRSRVNDYGWPDVSHRHEAEAFLVKRMSNYEDWKNCVQRWNDYITSYKPRNRTEVDDEFRQKIIAELSKSGLPQKRDESVINKNYADYEHFATRIKECWDEGDGWSYSVGRSRQMGYADGPDDKVEKLIGIVKNLIGGHLLLVYELKQKYKEALKKLEEDLEIQNQTQSEKWNDLLKGRNDFLAKLKQLHDDIEADRVEWS